MPTETRDKTSIVVCGVCWRVYDCNVGADSEPESWISLDELVTRKAFAPEDYLLSDGYCPECAAALVLYSSHSTTTIPRPHLDQTIGTFAS
jgi:hypothetical protein